MIDEMTAGPASSQALGAMEGSHLDPIVVAAVEPGEWLATETGGLQVADHSIHELVGHREDTDVALAEGVGVADVSNLVGHIGDLSAEIRRPNQARANSAPHRPSLGTPPRIFVTEIVDHGGAGTGHGGVDDLARVAVVRGRRAPAMRRGAPASPGALRRDSHPSPRVC